MRVSLRGTSHHVVQRLIDPSTSIDSHLVARLQRRGQPDDQDRAMHLAHVGRHTRWKSFFFLCDQDRATHLAHVALNATHDQLEVARAQAQLPDGKVWRGGVCAQARCRALDL